jgi:hypothetical protein
MLGDERRCWLTVEAMRKVVGAYLHAFLLLAPTVFAHTIRRVLPIAPHLGGPVVSRYLCWKGTIYLAIMTIDARRRRPVKCHEDHGVMQLWMDVQGEAWVCADTLKPGNGLLST